MTISINDTTRYHRSDAASLGWEQTISECLKDIKSPYMNALKTRRLYGDTISDLFKANSILKANARILEVGGGYGRFAARLLENYPDISMVMADVSPVFLHRQKGLLSRFGARVDFVNSDIFEYLDICDEFDLIVANEVVGDLPAIVDIKKTDLIEFIESGKFPECIDVEGEDCLFQARDFVQNLKIEIDGENNIVPDVINLNTGAMEFISMAMKKTPALWVSEHSSDYEIPKSMAGMFRDTMIDRWPKKIILFKHNEVSICFEHLKRGIKNSGYKYTGGSLMELLNVRTDDEIRFILLSGSIANENHEIIGEFINHVKEYQWLLVQR